MLCLGLRCGGPTCPWVLTELGGSNLLCHSICCNNVGNGGADIDRQYDMNIWELLLWDVAC